MNTTNTQAQKGFRTFVLTLSISLIVFSIIYYFVSESQTQVSSEEKKSVAELNVNKNEETSVFQKIAAVPVAATSKAVLAGTDTTADDTTTTDETDETTTPTPETGATSVTIGFFASLLAFAGGLFVIWKNPRALALLGFEKRVLKDLDGSH
jgi:ABC-type anion transport system duplicated permease subunit